MSCSVSPKSTPSGAFRECQVTLWKYTFSKRIALLPGPFHILQPNKIVNFGCPFKATWGGGLFNVGTQTITQPSDGAIFQWLMTSQSQGFSRYFDISYFPFKVLSEKRTFIHSCIPNLLGSGRPLQPSRVLQIVVAAAALTMTRWLGIILSSLFCNLRFIPALMTKDDESVAASITQCSRSGSYWIDSILGRKYSTFSWSTSTGMVRVQSSGSTFSFRFFYKF